MADDQQLSLPIPFKSRLGAQLIAGQTLTVQGRANADAKRFEVNLLAGTDEISTHVGSDALHISIRFDEGKVVFNSLTTGTWGKEERVSNPFKVGEPFDLRIRLHDDKFEVTANHKELHDFKHRVPFVSIDHLLVSGDLSLDAVQWGGRYYTLPFETGFPHGHLGAGQRVFIQGTPKGERFNIDFVAPNGDTLFHYNPRLGAKQVVRNAQLGGAWGAEEREGPFPFKKDQGFDLTINNEAYSIQIFVDGKRVGTWQHRTPHPEHDYVALRVQGDLELTGLQFSH